MIDIVNSFYNMFLVKNRRRVCRQKVQKGIQECTLNGSTLRRSFKSVSPTAPFFSDQTLCHYIHVGTIFHLWGNIRSLGGLFNNRKIPRGNIVSPYVLFSTLYIFSPRVHRIPKSSNCTLVKIF